MNFYNSIYTFQWGKYGVDTKNLVHYFVMEYGTLIRIDIFVLFRIPEILLNIR